jgi:hypothetical protein
LTNVPPYRIIVLESEENVKNIEENKKRNVKEVFGKNDRI